MTKRMCACGFIRSQYEYKRIPIFYKCVYEIQMDKDTQYMLEEAGQGRTIKSGVVPVPNGIFIARGVSVFVSMPSVSNNTLGPPAVVVINLEPSSTTVTRELQPNTPAVAIAD
jgi:hypothetical protein